MAKKTTKTETERGQGGQNHATWVREHPTIGPSAFPEYPDEIKRRGASRGALPNGNPWRPERADERPGPRWSQGDSRDSAPSPGNPKSVAGRGVQPTVNRITVAKRKAGAR
jgi:hypothetical protein